MLLKCRGKKIILSFDYTNRLIHYKEMLQLYSGCHINPGENIKLGHQSLWGIRKTGLLRCKTNVSCGHGKCDGKSCTAAAKWLRSYERA